MTAFILSSAIAFALYQLLAFTRWPPAATRFHFYRATLVLTRASASFARHIIRASIVVAVLLFVLTIHNVAAPIDALVNYEVNIVFGFVFGPLFAIWVNGIVLHSPDKDLTRGQILAAIGLVLLFLLGAVGNETSRLIRQYARSLSSVKVAGAELSFTAKERGDRLTSTTIAGSSDHQAGKYSSGGSSALQNLAILDGIIERDSDYVTKVFAPKDKAVPVADLDRARKFAQASIAPALSCLSAWFQQSGDSRPVDKYLTGYADLFRQLEALNAQINAPAIQPPDSDERKTLETQRLNEVSSDFVRNGLTMALDIALSTTQKDVPDACAQWFKVYCPSGGKPGSNASLPKCLRDGLKQFTQPSDAPKTGAVAERIASLANGLAEFITPQQSVDSRGLEMLPYFAIGRASLMAQLGQHEAAAEILDDWLKGRRDENARPEKQDEFKKNPLLQIKDDWFALRVRSMLVTYVEGWLGDGETGAAAVVQTEHLQNLQATRDGFKSRLLQADFFQELDKSCRTKCEPVFRRPAGCNSNEPDERLKLWGKLYSSYITMEYTYIHRALGHPDYRTKFAETVNDEARRLVNYDLSCGTDQPKPDVVYSQSLLAFVENAVGYSKVRAGKDSEDTQKKRLDEAERAAILGLEIVRPAATDDQERTGKRFLDRIAPSFAVQVQENLRTQLKKIEQAKKELAE
jgi:hypothetical protein